MHTGQLVFAQLMDHLPWKTFGRIVDRYSGDHRVRDFRCANQFRRMAFAQFTYRDSLCDIITCLRAQSAKLYHLGIRGTVAKSTLADRERGARLAHLCGGGTAFDQNRARAPRERTLRRGSQGHRLCVGFDHHRPVLDAVPVDTVSFDQGSDQAAHADRPAWEHPELGRQWFTAPMSYVPVLALPKKSDHTGTVPPVHPPPTA